MLGADDVLSHRPRRVLIAGRSGSGKTTFARRVGELLGLPHTEIDGLFHGAEWTPRPEFRADVEALVAADTWVTEWQYGVVRPLLASRADTIVWLDLPFRTAFVRLVRRTVRRRLRREVLWNGNLEPPLHTFFTDPEHVVRYMIRNRRRLTELVPSLATEHAHLTVIRLTSPVEVELWLSRLSTLPTS